MRPFLSAALAASLLTPAAAQVTAEQTVSREVVTLAADGTRVVSEEPARLVAPGDRVVYRLAYRNEGERPATGLVLAMPVPPDVTLLAGSAEGPGAVAYSVDGDRYGALDALTVPTEAGERPATLADIRSLRWALDAPLAPGARGEVAYKAVLR